MVCEKMSACGLVCVTAVPNFHYKEHGFEEEVMSNGSQRAVFVRKCRLRQDNAHGPVLFDMSTPEKEESSFSFIHARHS